MANHKYMSELNLTTLFKCVQDMPSPLTKKQLQELTGFSWGLISQDITYLISKGLLKANSSKDNTKGRHPLVIDINDSDNYVIGLDINLAGLTGVVLDLKCRVKATIEEPVETYNENYITDKSISIIKRLIKISEAQGKIRGIGIAFPGSVDPERGIIAFSHHYFGQRESFIRDTICDVFKVPVKVDQDPNCLALTEMKLGKARGVSKAIVIRADFGIGASIIIDNKIYHGATGNTGELGHVIVNPNGSTCSCGQKGCLETLASIESIIGSANSQDPAFAPLVPSTNRKPPISTFHDFMREVNLGDISLNNILEKAINYLSIEIANFSKLFDPQLIIIGGQFANYLEIVAAINQKVNSYLWSSQSVIVVPAEKINTAVSIGAGLLIFEEVYNNIVN